MTGTNNFLTFAEGSGANVLSQTDYAALTDLISNGFSDGVADPAQLNKVWRQASAIAHMIGAFIASQGYDALDNAGESTLLANFISALNSGVNLTGYAKLSSANAFTGANTHSGSETFSTPPAITTPASAGVVTAVAAAMSNFAQGANGTCDILLSSQSASASTYVTFTGIPTVYDELELVWNNAVLAGNAYLMIQVSNDNGSTWHTTASDYQTGIFTHDVTAATAVYAWNGANAGAIPLVGSLVLSGDSDGTSGNLRMHGCTKSAPKTMNFHSSNLTSGGSFEGAIGFARMWTGTSSITGIRFLTSSGVAITSGTFTLKAKRQS